MTQPMMAFSQAATIDKRITDLGGLVSLALALATVFTAARSQAFVARDLEQGKTKLRVLRALGVDLALLVGIVLLTLAALPLFIDALTHLNVTKSAGALRTVFAIVWLLLIGLIMWQLALTVRTVRQFVEANRWR